MMENNENCTLKGHWQHYKWCVIKVLYGGNNSLSQHAFLSYVTPTAIKA